MRGKIQVLWLQAEPLGRAARVALAEQSAADWLQLDGDALLWWPAGPMSKSELDLRAIERAVGPTTTRTKNTIERLAAKHLA